MKTFGSTKLPPKPRLEKKSIQITPLKLKTRKKRPASSQNVTPLKRAKLSLTQDQTRPPVNSDLSGNVKPRLFNNVGDIDKKIKQG